MRNKFRRKNDEIERNKKEEFKASIFITTRREFAAQKIDDKMDKRMYNMITKKTNNLNNSLTNNYVTDVASLLESCKTKSRKLTNKQFTPSALIIVASNGVNPLE